MMKPPLPFSCTESQWYGNRHPPPPISISTVSVKSADPRHAHFMLRLIGYSYLYYKKKKKVIKQVDQQQSFKKALSGRTPNSTDMGVQHHKSQP